MDCLSSSDIFQTQESQNMNFCILNTDASAILPPYKRKENAQNQELVRERER